MKPLREDPQSPREVAELLEAARQTDAFTPNQQAAVWSRINETADARKLQRNRPWLLAVPALAALAIVVVIVRGQAPASDPQTLAAAKQFVTPSAGAQFAVESDAVALRSGEVVAGPGARVRTPQLEITVQSAHCRIQVAGELTTIDVHDGELRVRRGQGPELVLSGAVRFRSDDPRLNQPPATGHQPPTPVDAMPSTQDTCANLSLDARRACYTRLAMGSDLAAQNAVYMLGQLEREAHQLPSAIDYWSAYERRFPDGALWPEAAAAMLTARMDQGQWPEALAAADAYLSRVPQGGRSPEVRLIRANLLREHLGKTLPALEAYRALAESSAPANVRAEARFGQALAAEKLGLALEAREALQAYARDFPQGPHAAEVARMLAP
ncbi:MAG: tetratricopeptide repeat protein [Deltaproteobacteria bacterium]|nr:tetratricopeptide repeat protein [Deltaproteobacteria bacterium]